MRQLLNIYLLSWIGIGLSQAQGASFPVHVSPGAETLQQWEVAFQPYPGSNPLKDYAFLLNSLSVGIWDGVEIGTVPLMWQENENFKVSNYNLKARMFRLSNWTFAIGYELVDFQSKGEIARYFDSVMIQQIAWSIEHRPVGSRYQFRYNIATAQLAYTNYAIMYVGDEPIRMGTWIQRGQWDSYVDIQYNASDTNSWVLGLTRNHDWFSGLVEDDKPRWGAGLSHGWQVKNDWVSGFSVGLHLREASGVKVLGSMKF